MKKIFRITALILAAIMLSVTLCSCNYLDSARAHRAFYTDDKKREIEFEGHTYKYLNPNKYDYIYSDLYDQDGAYVVTTKDVPVLLASRMGDYVNMVEGKTLLYLWGTSDEPLWYVRDDVYEEMSSRIANAKMDHYYYYYYVPEELYGGVIQKNELLSDEMTEIINRTASISDDKKVSYKELGEEDRIVQSVAFNACDQDMSITNNKYLTVIKDRTDYYVWDGNTYEEKVLCPIKEEDVPVVKAFFKENEQVVYGIELQYMFDDSAYDYYVEDYESVWD